MAGVWGEERRVRFWEGPGLREGREELAGGGGPGLSVGRMRVVTGSWVAGRARSGVAQMTRRSLDLKHS